MGNHFGWFLLPLLCDGQVHKYNGEDAVDEEADKG